jgi:hypothetical protein
MSSLQRVGWPNVIMTMMMEMTEKAKKGKVKISPESHQTPNQSETEIRHLTPLLSPTLIRNRNQTHLNQDVNHS